METLVVASNEQDAEAVERLENNNAEIIAALAARANALLTGNDLSADRTALVTWSDSVLVPYTRTKTEHIARAAAQAATTSLLADALGTGATAIASLVDKLRAATEALEAIGAAQALRALVEVQYENEQEHLIPTLASTSGVDLAGIVDAAVAAAGAPAEAAHGHAEEHSCNCGEKDDEGWPELDARVVPHAIRHATVFGALDAVAPGRGMVLVAPHDPLPLLGQIEQRHPGVFDVSYLARGPEAWRLQFLRRP